jgi:hypothetical protein
VVVVVVVEVGMLGCEEGPLSSLGFPQISGRVRVVYRQCGVV